jgi:CheY-like chemotaxis protein
MSQSPALKNRYAVLIIEDDAGVATMLETMLRQHFKCHTVVARNGVLALGMAFATLPDIILADLCLPVLDGFEVIRLLKEHPELHEVPIVAFSNHAWDIDWTKKAIDAGCNRCSHKQLTVEEMGALLREMLEPEESIRPAEADVAQK